MLKINRKLNFRLNDANGAKIGVPDSKIHGKY